MNTNIIKSKKTHTMDMCSGNLFAKIIKFCLPLALMGVLNLLYNAADLIVVSNFSGDSEALGAVGSTSTLINLIVNLFMGLSVGTNVVCARYFGARNYEGVRKAVHTSILISLIFGIFLGVFGFIFADTLLSLMHNELELSRIYLKIYFLGMPFNLMYNFASAILRAVGDTKRPLRFLSIAGITNVILNLVFVIIFKMSVAGVALATIISQFISCVLIIISMMRSNECYKFRFKWLMIYKKELKDIVLIGLPAGIQSSIFSISNTLIQSSVNMFDINAINGNTAAQNVEGFVYTIMNSVYHAALAFTGQNVGARKTSNIKKITLYSLIIVTMSALITGIPLFIFGKYVVQIYTTVPQEIEVAYIRLHYLCLPYFLCGIMDVMCGVMRGLGYSTLPTFVSIIGVCGIRIGWILLIFRASATYTNFSELNLLYISYPISWTVTFLIHFGCYLVLSRKRIKDLELENLLIK